MGKLEAERCFVKFESEGERMLSFISNPIRGLLDDL